LKRYDFLKVTRETQYFIASIVVAPKIV